LRGIVFMHPNWTALVGAQWPGGPVGGSGGGSGGGSATPIAPTYRCGPHAQVVTVTNAGVRSGQRYYQLSCGCTVGEKALRTMELK
jgi:hypothetical protein